MTTCCTNRWSETVLEAIDRQLTRKGDSPDERELGTLVVTCDRLREENSAEELAASERYDDVCSRLETLEADLGGC